MLCPTVLGALAKIGPRFEGLDPHVVVTIGDDIGLAGEAWHPEAMHHIHRLPASERSAAAWAWSLTGTCTSLAVTIPRAG